MDFEHLKELIIFVGNITSHSEWDDYGNCICEWKSEIPFKSIEELEEAYQRHINRAKEFAEYTETMKNSFTYIYQQIISQKYGKFMIDNPIKIL